MNTPKFRPVNQQWVSPDPPNPKVRASVSQSDPTRASPTRPRRWSHQRPKSPRVVIPAQESLSHMARHKITAPGSLYSTSSPNKRKRRGPSHTPVFRRQAPRMAKPIPSIEESAQKGPFDPYAFLSHPSTPSLPSSSPSTLTTPENCGSDVSSQDGTTTQPHLQSIRPQEQSFGHRQSIPFRCNPRKHSSDPFTGYIATENARPKSSLHPRPLTNNDASKEIKKERSIAFTPVIKHTSLVASLPNTQVRERKLEENGVVEVDRDEYALQRFLKVQGEMTDLEAILTKGKKRHIFEQMKRNAATKSLRGVEKILAENEATPTPSGRLTSLQEGTTGRKLINEHLSEVVSKSIDSRTETSQSAPALFQDAPITSIAGTDKTDRAKKDHPSDLGAVHPSRRYVFDNPEGSPSHERSNPPKRKELPGMGLIFNPRPNRPQDDRKHQDKKLPRDLQRRQVDMPIDTGANTNDAYIENVINSAQDWLQSENALEQAARAKRWAPDPNWKDLTADQVDAMRRQGSIPPARFYGHPPKPPRLRRPLGWRQPPAIETPTITVAEADEILARVRRDQALRLLRYSNDKDPELASSKLPHSKDGDKSSKNHSEKRQSSAREESQHSPTTGSKDLSVPKATSTSREEKKDVMHVSGNEVDSQQVMRDDRPAVKPRVKPAKDTPEISKVKATDKKRKRDIDLSETAATAFTMKNVLKSPELPSMANMIEGSQVAIASSPPKKKKSKKRSGPEAVDDVVNDAKEPSTPPRSQKRKKAKETMEVHGAIEEGTAKKSKKRKTSDQGQKADETVLPRPETLFDRLRRMKRKKTALALQEASKERSEPTIPTSEAAKTKKIDRAPPTAAEPAIEDVWQPTIDDEDPISSPQPLPSSKKKHKSKHHRPANTSPTIAVDGPTPEPIESPPPPPASPPTPPPNSSFNHLRRRHQSLPLRLTPNPTPPTTNPNPNTHPPQPPTPPLPNLYDLNILAIRTRLSNLEAAVAISANPTPPPAPAPKLAARKIRLPPLPRAIPPGTTHLSDAELIQLGKKVNGYERHRGAPYVFSWRGRLYAEYDYLLDWVDGGGGGGWNCKEKARVKVS